MTYNLNRNKKAKQLHYLDFCFYKSSKDGSLPDWINGACMRAALKAGLFPSWALFVYAALAEVAADDEGAPECFIAQCEDVLVLNPVVEDDSLAGLVIMNESASEKIRTLGTNNGIAYTVKIPKINIKRTADENITLQILSMRTL